MSNVTEFQQVTFVLPEADYLQFRQWFNELDWAPSRICRCIGHHLAFGDILGNSQDQSKVLRDEITACS